MDKRPPAGGFSQNHFVGRGIDDATVAESVSETLTMLKEGAIVQAHVLGDLNAAIKARAGAERILDAALSH